MGCYVIAMRKPGTDIFEFDNRSYEDPDVDESCVFGNIALAAQEFEAAVVRHGKDNVMLLQIMNVDVSVKACARVQDEAGNVIYAHEGISWTGKEICDAREAP